MRYLILFLALCMGIAAQAQVMSSTQFGLAKVGSGLSVDGSGVLSAGDSFSALTYSASVTLDFNAANVQSVSLTGNITFSTSNRSVTKGKVMRIICDATSRTLTFPSGWVWLGAAAPTTVAASKTAVLSLYSFGTADTDIIASYAVQP